MVNEKQHELLLKNIIDIYTQEQNDVLQEQPTFLSIIARSYDECFVSRILAYILKNDYGFVGKLLNYYFKKKCPTYQDTSFDIQDITVMCEKMMNSGRADIFAIITTSEARYTITIENKIYSRIHGTAEDEEQTITYSRFVNAKYPSENNIFLLIKPEFNATETACEDFEIITYNKISEFISCDNTKVYKSITDDFKQHIKEYLTMSEIEFSKVDLAVIENLDEYRKIIGETENKINTFKNRLFDSVSKEILTVENGFIGDVKNDKDCCKFYLDKMWYKASQFWFYVEIKFNINDPKLIFVQSVIKRYGAKPRDSVVVQFINSDYFDDEFKRISSENYDFPNGKFYVFDTQNINQKIKYMEAFSCDWQDEMKKVVVDEVKRQIKQMKEIFKSFENFQTQKN